MAPPHPTPKTPSGSRRGRRARHGALFGAIAAVAACLAASAVARAAPLPAADSLSVPGATTSYWGPFPAATDSGAVGRFRNNGLPVWEAAVVYPWRVVTFPIKLVTQGLGAGLVALDDGGGIKTLAHIIAPPPVIRGFTPSATAGGAQGMGLGGSLYDKSFFSPNNEAGLRYEGTFRNAHKASFGVRLGRDIPRQADFIVGYRIRPTARFFGLGPESEKANNALYTQELSWVGAEVRQHLSGGWRGEVELLASQTRAGGTDADFDEHEKPLAERFAGNLPTGYGATSRGVTIGLGVLHDNTSETGRPESGGVRRVKVTWFKGFEDVDTNFWTFHVEAQQFIPLWFSKRALAVRGLVSMIEPGGSASVPFQRLNDNDDPELLRGYQDFRFRDRGLALLNAEYRWPIWADRVVRGVGLDMYLLTDVGQVFHTSDDLSLENLRVSYGGGFRFIGNRDGLGLRFEVAHSTEGTQLRLRTDQLFQYDGDRFFHGRNPIPSR